MSELIDLIVELENLIKDCSIESVDPIKVQMVETIASGYAGVFPNDLKAYLLHQDKFGDAISNLFHGSFWPMSLEDIAAEYGDFSKSKYFREYYILEEPDPAPGTTLDIPSPIGLRVYATLDREFDEAGYSEVHDMRRVVPLLTGESWYNVVLFNNDNGKSEIAVQEQDFGLCSIAPSLSEHLENIKMGLGNSSYSEDSGVANMPMYWYERVKAVSNPEFGQESWSS